MENIQKVFLLQTMSQDGVPSNKREDK